MKSPVKWLGGKRNEIKYFEKYIPNFGTYVEPMVGGGAVYWHLQPQKAHINDINPFLMNFYVQLRDNHETLERELQHPKNTEEEYKIAVRLLNEHIAGVNTFSDDFLACLFYYLNRTGFGGNWRVNKKGLYNVPYGRYEKDLYKILDVAYSEQLKETKITCFDYKNILEEYKGDESAFIFLDPPYNQSDQMYVVERNFDDIYQYLKDYMDNAKCKCMLVVKEDELIDDLFGYFIIDRYQKKYRVNSKSDNQHNHVVIVNYDI